MEGWMITIIFFGAAWWMGAAMMAQYLASEKGYDGTLWLVLALLFGFMGIIAAAGLPDHSKSTTESS